LGRPLTELVLTNIGELLTLAGHSERPLAYVDKNSIGALNTPDLCVASSEGKICFLGRRSDLSNNVDSASAEEIDCKGKLVLPGFIDCHTHTIFAGSRENELSLKLDGVSYMDILRQGGGILRTVRDSRIASDEELKSATRKRLDRMISCGTTTFEIKSGYALNVKGELRLLKVLDDLKEEGYDIESTLLSAHAIPEEYSGRPVAYVDEVVIASIDECSKTKLASFCDVFMEKGVFGEEETKKILKYAANRGLKLKLHADEFSDLGGAKLAANLGVVSADHLAKSSLDGIQQMGERGTVGVLLPGTQFSSLTGTFADARAYAQAGMPIALATDLSPNSWIESMQFVINIACYGMKLTPEEAIAGATINAAHAVSRSSTIGSIETGKNADILVTNLSNFYELPYRIASNNVKMVYKKGKLVRENPD
jgi:imidazolonepropionase